MAPNEWMVALSLSIVLLSSMVHGCPFAGQGRRSLKQNIEIGTGTTAETPSIEIDHRTVAKTLRATGEQKEEKCPQQDTEIGRDPVPRLKVDYDKRYCLIYRISQKMDEINLERAKNNDHSLTADLLRLVFHDCAPGHCDASVLLNRTEFNDPRNKNVEGANKIGEIKDYASGFCGPVSWADIIVLSTAIGVTRAGGPSMEYDIYLGREDRTDKDDHVEFLPSAHDDTPALVKGFADIFGTSPANAIKHLVALSGAHTVGDAACSTFKNRRETGAPKGQITPRLQEEMAEECPIDCLKQDFDIITPDRFDNAYFKNLKNKEGLLFSDQVLWTNNFTIGDQSTANYVNLFAGSLYEFHKAWKRSFTALTNLGRRQSSTDSM